MSVKIIQGDALTVLRTLESESVQCCVTSPPYFQLRDYGVDGQIGMESTPAEFIATLVAVFDEVRRVLRSDGVCFVNIADSYSGSGKGPSSKNGITKQHSAVGSLIGPTPIFEGIPAKNLLLIPERFAIAMQDAGWWVRSRIAWCKTSTMPESVRDRPTSAWEHVWMFTRTRTYYYDAEAVRVPWADSRLGGSGTKTLRYSTESGRIGDAGLGSPPPFSGANLRNFWLLGPAPSSLEHYAAYPPELVRRCILAGTSQRGACPSCGAPWVRVVERTASVANRKHYAAATNGALLNTHRGTVERPGGYYPDAPKTTDWAPSCSCNAGEPVPCVVLDPFLGSGTTAMVADRNQRDAIGIELSPIYANMARQRIARDAGPMFADVEVTA